MYYERATVTECTMSRFKEPNTFTLFKGRTFGAMNKAQVWYLLIHRAKVEVSICWSGIHISSSKMSQLIQLHSLRTMGTSKHASNPPTLLVDLHSSLQVYPSRCHIFMESGYFLFFSTHMSWYHFKDIKMIKSANLQWKTQGAELFYYILKSTTFKCMAHLMLGSFFSG